MKNSSKWIFDANKWHDSKQTKQKEKRFTKISAQKLLNSKNKWTFHKRTLNITNTENETVFGMHYTTILYENQFTNAKLKRKM